MRVVYWKQAPPKYRRPPGRIQSLNMPVTISLRDFFMIRTVKGISPFGTYRDTADCTVILDYWLQSATGGLQHGDAVLSCVMPGLNEELVDRGVLPARLSRLFPPTWELASARIGWKIATTTILFGLLHGLWLDAPCNLHIEAIWIRNALPSGLIFAWLRSELAA